MPRSSRSRRSPRGSRSCWAATCGWRRNWLDGVKCEPGEVVLCENVRFNKGEKKNSDELARRMAALCDIFVMDAFGTAHRAEASTHGVAQLRADRVRRAAAGQRAGGARDGAGKARRGPMIAIVGGSKVSTKLTVLEALLAKVDQLIVGGGIANTFLAAAGFPVGKSLYEAEMVDIARRLMEESKRRDTEIPLPTDVVVAQ